MLFTKQNHLLKSLIKYSFFILLAFILLSRACTTNTPSIQIKKSETFYNNLTGVPENLHPIKSTDSYSGAIQRHVVETLLVRNLDTYQWEPSLARKWHISPNKKEFTFYLHKDLKWSDGKPLTSSDVKFSFDAYKNPKYGGISYISYYENLHSAKIIDDHTITFKAKNIYFGNFQTIAGMGIIPQHIYQDPKLKLSKTVIGSGPYKIEHNIKGKILILRKNPFWQGNRPSNKNKWNFKTIVFRFIQSETNALLRLQRGDIDYTRMGPESYIQKTNKKPWGITIQKIKTPIKKPKGFDYIGFNLTKPLFQDKKVRKALAHLMNRKLMNSKFFFNLNNLATGPWSFKSDFANPNVKAINFNPKKAQQLLKSANWRDKNKDGILEKTINGQNFDFKFTIIYSAQSREKLLTLYQEDLKKVGIKLNLKILDWTSFLRLLDDKNFDAVMLGWGGGAIDLDPKQIWHSSSASKGGSNFIGYSNPKVDALIDKGRQQLNRNKRIKTFQKVYRLIAEDVPYIFMFNSSYTFYGVNKRIYRPKDSFNYRIGEMYWDLKTK